MALEFSKNVIILAEEQITNSLVGEKVNVLVDISISSGGSIIGWIFPMVKDNPSVSAYSTLIASIFAIAETISINTKKSIRDEYKKILRIMNNGGYDRVRFSNTYSIINTTGGSYKRYNGIPNAIAYRVKGTGIWTSIN